MSDFLVAAHRLQIDSPPGLKMAGFGARLDGALGTHDPLFVRAVRMESADQTIIWIACDLIGVATDVDAMLRQRVAASAGVTANRVFISCSHTHGSVNSITFRGPLGAPDSAWLETLADRMAAVVAPLKSRLGPASMSMGTTVVAGLGYNRQDATAPIDEQLTAIAFDSVTTGRRIATMFNYALHPVTLGENNRLYTADIPGFAAAAAEEQSGGVALWIQGACGDVEPVNYRDLGRGTGTFELAEAMGHKIAAAVPKALAESRPVRDIALAVGERVVALPLDEPPTREALAAVRREFAEARGPVDAPFSSDEQKWAAFELEWADDLAAALDTKQITTTMPVRIAAAKIGTARIVAIPTEVYAAIGLTLKQALSPDETLIAAYTGGLIGYVATDKAKDQGGYGPARSHRVFKEQLTAFGYGAAALLAREAASLAQSLDHPAFEKTAAR